MSKIQLNNNIILGDDQPVWIVAEIGLCHNGDINLAKKMIRESARHGADAVKFQKRDVDNLAIGSVLDARDTRFPSFGDTYRQVRHHIEFNLSQYKELQDCAREVDVPIFASVFDVKSAEQMASINMPLMKVASHCLSHRPLLDCLCSLKIPTVLSTGMATWEEIDETAELLSKANVEFGFYHCVSDYPHTYETANLTLISEMRRRYDVPIGYSSHELDNQSAFLATVLGAFSIEKHVTLNRKSEGFDHGIAQDMSGLKDLVEGVRRAEKSMGDGKKFVSDKEMITRKKYHSSVVSMHEISIGTKITSDMLMVKNPGEGIPAREIYSIIGKKTKKLIAPDVLITWDMLEH